MNLFYTVLVAFLFCGIASSIPVEEKVSIDDSLPKIIDETIKPKPLKAPKIKDENEKMLKLKDTKEEKIKDEVKVDMKSPREDKPKVEYITVTDNFGKSKNVSLYNLCEASADFKYFIPYPLQPQKYIQCDPWGTTQVLDCPVDMYWNEWMLKCDLIENIKNITSKWMKLETRIRSNVTNCLTTGLRCLNAGICTPFDKDFRCVCEPEFTGEFCETKLFMHDIYTTLRKGSFSLNDYIRKQLTPGFVKTIDNSSNYEKLEENMDKESYSQMTTYLNSYPQGQMRFDTLVNYLVNDILREIYTDSYYLNTMNATCQNVLAVVRLIPELLSYSKYSFERYEYVFVEFKQALDLLIKTIKPDWPSYKEEALRYLKLTDLFLNKTIELQMNQTARVGDEFVSKESKFTEKEIKEKIQNQFNTTLKHSFDLYEKLAKFQEEVLEHASVDKNVINLTLDVSKFSGSEAVKKMFADIRLISKEIWDSLVNYGFWYITSELAEKPIKA